MTFGKWAPSEKPIFCMNKRREGRAAGGEESGEHRIGKRRPQALASCAMRWSRPACGGRMPPAGFSCALATTATTATTTGTTTATTPPTTTAATTAATTATTTAPTTATTATTITYCRVPLRYYSAEDLGRHLLRRAWTVAMVAQAAFIHEVRRIRGRVSVSVSWCQCQCQCLCLCQCYPLAPPSAPRPRQIQSKSRNPRQGHPQRKNQRQSQGQKHQRTRTTR